MASVKKRISDLEARSDTGGGGGFAEALREGRVRAAGGEAFVQPPVTPQMLDDPACGELYRLICEARERVRNY